LQLLLFLKKNCPSPTYGQATEKTTNRYFFVMLKVTRAHLHSFALLRNRRHVFVLFVMTLFQKLALILIQSDVLAWVRRLKIYASLPARKSKPRGEAFSTKARSVQDPSMQSESGGYFELFSKNSKEQQKGKPCFPDRATPWNRQRRGRLEWRIWDQANLSAPFHKFSNLLEFYLNIWWWCLPTRRSMHTQLRS